jgi:ABC-type transport system involved in cytochrome c biogenesis permease subunit
MSAETVATTLGMALYLAAAGTAVAFELMRSRRYGWVVGLLVAALIVHGTGIGLRWARLGHGPYVNQYEILSSNIHTLHTALLLGVLAISRLKPLLAAVLPMLSVMVVWFLVVPPTDSLFPITYATVWLPVHVWLGKIFMGIMMLAVGGSVVILLRWRLSPEMFPTLPHSRVIDEINYSLILLAFTFECLMLIAGAVWAQDAWGRYWSWDPLETWSFLTWLAVASFLHLRAVKRLRPHYSALLAISLFLLAYYTFFGVPFVSTNAHRGIF